MVLILLAALCADRNADLLEKKSYAALAGNPEETAAFRSMAVPAGVFESISSTCKASEESWASVLAAYMLDHQFAPATSKDARPPEDGNYWSERVRGYERKNPEAFERLAQSYEAVYADLAVFPVPVSDMHSDAEVSYENSWMFERTFGGVRGHEGTDLMPSVKKDAAVRKRAAAAAVLPTFFISITISGAAAQTNRATLMYHQVGLSVGVPQIKDRPSTSMAPQARIARRPVP